MKKTIIFLVLLFTFSICYAGQKYFYDPTTNKSIVDVSGLKTKDDILMEYNLANCEELAFDEKSEVVSVIDKKLVKYNFQEDNKKIAEKAKKSKAEKEKKIKQKLNMTEEEFADLKEVIE